MPRRPLTLKKQPVAPRARKAKIEKIGIASTEKRSTGKCPFSSEEAKRFKEIADQIFKAPNNQDLKLQKNKFFALLLTQVHVENEEAKYTLTKLKKKFTDYLNNKNKKQQKPIQASGINPIKAKKVGKTTSSAVPVEDLIDRIRKELHQENLILEDTFKRLVEESTINASFSMSSLVRLLHSEVINDKQKIERLKTVLTSFRLCCGSPQFYRRRWLQCQADKQCYIETDKPYHFYKNKESPKTVHFCTNHFEETGLKYNNGGNKIQFQEGINSGEEEMERCKRCGGYFHRTCKFSGLLKDREGCNCAPPITYSKIPKQLIEVESSKAIQSEVRACTNLDIVVRCSLSVKKTDVFDTEVAAFFEKMGVQLPELRYTEKMYHIFVKQDGYYIVFFSLLVSEFGQDYPGSKKGSTCIKYFDSAPHLKVQKRKEVYYSILNSYFKEIKKRGYWNVNLWACPPEDSTDYLYSGRIAPKEYASKKEKKEAEKNSLARLKGFYNEMTKGMRENIVECSHPKLNSEGEGIVHFILKNYHTGGLFEAVLNLEVTSMIQNEKIMKESPASIFDKLEKMIVKTFNEKSGESFNWKLRDVELNGLAIEDPDIELRSRVSESREEWLETQYIHNLEFAHLSHAICSTKKLVELLVEEQAADH